MCGADDTLRIARAALHEWEEPVISVGAGSGTVFFSGCPLRCVYCQNIDISTGNRGREISVERLADIFFELIDQGAANINLVTPTHYVCQIKAAIDNARARGFAAPIVYNTSGYECPETIVSLAGYVDVYLTDFKYASGDVSDAAQSYSNAADYHDVALAALDEMVGQIGEPVYRTTEEGLLLEKGIVVRHLLMPGRLDDSRRVMEELWNRYGNEILYSLMSQYTPMGRFPQTPELEQRVDAEEYEALLDYLDELGIEDYFWQEGGADEKSFIPVFDETGVHPGPR